MSSKTVLIIINRHVSSSSVCSKKATVNNLKGKSVSSQHWLTRHLKDPYVEKAKMMNYRCRSAFKLLEIDDKFSILKPGFVVIDCGAAPGSWTQVAINRVNADSNRINKPKGTVIAIDKLQIYPIEHASILGNSDFTAAETQQRLKMLLDNSLIDVVLSDMAPQASGIKVMDQENIINLCYSAFRFAVQMSTVNSTLLVKLWQGTGAPELERDLLKFYKTVRIVKPSSSRSDSAEIFLLARQFKGLKQT
ncbi:Mitochondrial rRNA methyltransferase 2 [Carabus blaptoides fortunei]